MKLQAHFKFSLDDTKIHRTIVLYKTKLIRDMVMYKQILISFFGSRYVDLRASPIFFFFTYFLA